MITQPIKKIKIHFRRKTNIGENKHVMQRLNVWKAAGNARIFFKVKFGYIGKPFFVRKFLKAIETAGLLWSRAWWKLQSSCLMLLLQDSLQFSNLAWNLLWPEIRNLPIHLCESTPIKNGKRTLKTLKKASPSQRKSQSVRANSLADKIREVVEGFFFR